MLNKILFCATVDYHFKAFHLPILKWFKDQGWEVHVAASGNINLPYVDRKYDIPIQRSPIKTRNLQAYKELRRIMEENDFQLIHCHTPMGGVLARLAARKAREKGTNVLYTAHGFHFCKGSSLMSWLIYFPIEKYLSRFTDCLITINTEDYQAANKHHFKAKSIKHVHGVGVDTTRFKPPSPLEKAKLREKYGYKPEEILLFYAAEFNQNKNQQLLIHALAQIKNQAPNSRLLLAGEGALLDDCNALATTLGVQGMVDFLGYRSDIEELLKASDIGVASSLREGLPVNIMEAMACGLPIVAMDNRGHNELIRNGENGWLVKGQKDLAVKLQVLIENQFLIKELGLHGRSIIENQYSLGLVKKENSEIYNVYMNMLGEKKWAVH
jgi:glycosyltransferase EpsD